MIRIILLSIILSLFSSESLQAQDISARVTINTQKAQVTNTEIFTSLENSLNQFLSEQKWTNATFNRSERIDCSFSIAINEMVTENSFNAEIVITSRRPVYNSAYQTTLLNFRDTQFSFNHTYGQSLDYNSLSITDNLVAVMAYYAYIVVGLDFDSFSNGGGKPYFTKALEIANSAQTLNTKGWEPFANKTNRYDIAIALTDGNSQEFHTLWYNYHRMGLDEMAANPARGRIRIIETIANLKTMQSSRSSSPLLTLFGESKLDELIRICSECNQDEKREIRKTLLQIFPTKSSQINTLK